MGELYQSRPSLASQQVGQRTVTSQSPVVYQSGRRSRSGRALRTEPVADRLLPSAQVVLQSATVRTDVAERNQDLSYPRVMQIRAVPSSPPVQFSADRRSTPPSSSWRPSVMLNQMHVYAPIQTSDEEEYDVVTEASLVADGPEVRRRRREAADFSGPAHRPPLRDTMVRGEEASLASMLDDFLPIGRILLLLLLILVVFLLMRMLIHGFMSVDN